MRSNYKGESVGGAGGPTIRAVMPAAAARGSHDTQCGVAALQALADLLGPKGMTVLVAAAIKK